MNRIAVPLRDGNTSVSLERADTLRIYETEHGEILTVHDIRTDSNIARLLRRSGVTAILCGMLTDMSRRELAIAGIEVLAGVYGNDRELVRKLMLNELRCEPDTSRAFFAGHYSPCVNEYTKNKK